MVARISRRTWALALLAMLVSVSAWAEEKPNVIISWSHSSPDTVYARRYVRDLERRPFDGVVMTIDPRDADWLDEAYWQGQIEWARSKKLDYLAEMYERPRETGSLNWGGGSGLTASGNSGPWNPNCRYTEKTLARALADLKATDFRRFRFNLIETFAMAPTTDWFDDAAWVQRCRNYAMVARLAKQAGCRGILFDDEQYGEGCVWNYTELRKRKAVHGRGLEETRAQARQRGKQFARAISSEFPGIVFWTLHGYSTIASLVDCGLPEYGSRSLKPPFYDGMLEGAGEEMVFVDGGEVAYGYNMREHFEWGRRLAKEEPIRMGLTQVPDLHRKHVRCGFGIWPDYYGKIDPDNPENSYFSPGRWRRAVNLALELSDGYVWVYGERWHWWAEGPDGRPPIDIYQGRRGLPLAYWDALEAGKTSPGEDASPVRRMQTTNLPSHGRNYCIEGDALAALTARSEAAFVLPREGWTFKLDDWGTALDDRAGFNKPVAIGKRWDEQGLGGDDSMGFYRLEFTLPEDLKGRKLHFLFPDVDGSVWLSSLSCPRPQAMAWRYVGVDPQANRKPFVLTNPELSSYFFEPGKPAVVVIKVRGIDGAGGILEPIQVLAEK